MNESILSGPNLSFVGISTVFVALMLMYGAINLMRRLVAPETGTAKKADAAGVSENDRNSNGDSAGEREDMVRGIALATYAYHVSKSVRVPHSAGSSPWQRAGRTAQVTARRTRS